MFTVLFAGICALVFEPHHGLPPMVIVGNITDSNQCVWQFTIASGTEIERAFIIGAGEHSIKAKIGEAYATVTIDTKEFKVPRNNSL